MSISRDINRLWETASVQDKETKRKKEKKKEKKERKKKKKKVTISVNCRQTRRFAYMAAKINKHVSQKTYAIGTDIPVPRGPLENFIRIFTYCFGVVQECLDDLDGYVTSWNCRIHTRSMKKPFIPLACAECHDSVPFSAASSIPLCYVLFPATLLHQLFFHPLSPHLAIYFLDLSILLFPNSYVIPLLTILFPSILCTCPNQRNLFNFIVFIIAGFFNTCIIIADE